MLSLFYSKHDKLFSSYSSIVDSIYALRKRIDSVPEFVIPSIRMAEEDLVVIAISIRNSFLEQSGNTDFWDVLTDQNIASLRKHLDRWGSKTKSTGMPTAINFDWNHHINPISHFVMIPEIEPISKETITRMVVNSLKVLGRAKLRSLKKKDNKHKAELKAIWTSNEVQIVPFYNEQDVELIIKEIYTLYDCLTTTEYKSTWIRKNGYRPFRELKDSTLAIYDLLNRSYWVTGVDDEAPDTSTLKPRTKEFKAFGSNFRKY